MALLPKYSRAGADEFVTVGGASDVEDLAEMVIARRQTPPPRKELRQMEAGEPTWSMDVVRHCVRNSWRHLSPGKVAERFGIAPRTLRDRLADAQLPRPSDLCRMGHFLHAVELMRHGVTAPAEVAQRLGFGSATDMRKRKWQLAKTVEADHRAAAFASQYGSLVDFLYSRGED